MRFLIIDAQRLSRESLTQAVYAAGHSAIPLQDGQQGLQALAVGHYDCVVTELTLPVVDGLEMIRRMRRAGDLTPVLICSAEITAAARDAARKLGVFEVICKPIDNARLVTKLVDAAETPTIASA